MDRKRQKLNPEKVSGGSPGTMADSCCIAELKETIEKMNAELVQSHTKISELYARVREQEEGQKEMSNLRDENAQLARALKEKDVRNECHIRNVIDLYRKLDDMKTELKLQQTKYFWEWHSHPTTSVPRNLMTMTSALICESAMQNKSQVTAKLEQVTKENSYLKSKIEKKEERWTKLLCENEILRKYLQDLQSANINQEEKTQINLSHSDLTSQIMKIEEASNDALGINSLPNEMLLEIFGYLEQNQLGQIARVCRRWNALRKSPVLWKKVHVIFHWSHKFQNTVTSCFVNMLPSCVTSIRLDYSSLDCTEQLNFAELCVKLQRRCPCLETLILERVHLSDNLPSVISLCTEFLPGVKILVVRHSIFSDCPTKREFGGISKIEVLDVSDCNLLKYLHEVQFSKMPQLRVLNLRNTRFVSRAFQSLQDHGLNLEELYLCSTLVSKDNLMFTSSMFPHLKMICLHCFYSTREAIVSVIQSCRLLQKIYVREHFVKTNLRAHPFFKNNRSGFNVVEGIAKDHSHYVDYSYKTNKI